MFKTLSCSLGIKRQRYRGRERAPMVLNPHGIEPTFLKLGSWLPGAGFIPIITYNVLNQIKKELKKKISFMHTKNITTILENG